MSILIDKIRLNAKLISRLVLVTLLIWFITPPTNSITQSFTGKIFKPNSEQVQIHFEASKQNSVQQVAKEASFILQSDFVKPGIQLTGNLIRSFLHVNSFVRNTFYVYTTINAP